MATVKVSKTLSHGHILDILAVRPGELMLCVMMVVELLNYMPSLFIGEMVAMILALSSWQIGPRGFGIKQ